MRNPWLHDLEEEGPPVEWDNSHGRQVLKVGIALWLVVGVAIVGLVLGTSVAPRRDDGVVSGGEATPVVDVGPDVFRLLVPVDGRYYGVVVGGPDARLSMVLDGAHVVLLR